MEMFASMKRKMTISGLLFIGMVLSFFDRVALNVAIIPMGDEFHLKTSQTGLVISIFFISYSFMQPLGGWMTDKFGARVMITISLCPSSRLGRSCLCSVTLREGFSCTEEEIITFCKERTSKYIVPKVVYFKDSLPLTHIGKVDKKELKKMYAEMVY